MDDDRKRRYSCALTLKYTFIGVYWWTRQRIHNTLIVVDRYLRLMGDKTIPDSAEPRLESFYPQFVAGIDLPHQGVVDSYNLSIRWKNLPVTIYMDLSKNFDTLQSIAHPHPKPIKLPQAGWPLLSMCICCSGVMTTPVVSGWHWGSQWVPYVPLRNIQLFDTSCSHWGAAGISTLAL